MIYDTIDFKKVTLGKPSFFKDSQKFIRTIYYDDDELVFTLKNKYYIVSNIKENDFGKKYLELHSKKLNDVIDSVYDHFEIPHNDFKRYIINQNTLVSKSTLDDLLDKKFKALISFSISSIFEDENGKKSVQLNVKEIVVLEIFSHDIEYDVSKLSLAD